MSNRPRDDDLEARVDDLAATLDALRDELADLDEREGLGGRERRPRRRTPPRPGEFLRFTEEYTIPTLVSFLEANIRALELLQGLLRIAGGRDLPRGDADRERVTRAGQRALDGVDAVLSDLGDALEGQPTDEDARDLLGEARTLRRDIDDALRGRSRPTRQVDDVRDDPSRRDAGTDADDADGPISIAVEDRREDENEAERTGADRDAGDATDAPPGVDVDAELDAIRHEVRGDEEGDESSSPDEEEE
ncbi:DUF7547 family protein [Halomarina ordinaria]|uniref:Uncharacterized protein n=1 Tax=Halomarina ordinaria TaxID=3033939 RepID=A0ABD5U678_9EURY|nr:hypothetical protein [Halomarina sp. PSRA2]